MKSKKISLKNNKLALQALRLCVAIVLFAAIWCITHFVAMPKYAALILFLLPYAIAGYDIVFKAFRNIAHGRVFDENFLMLIATVGALVIGDYPESVAVLLFYQTGELFQRYATGKSRRSISHLMELNPDTAFVLREGQETEIATQEIVVGDTVILRNGARVPVDATIIEGRTSFDMSALTGESVPVMKQVGDRVSGGVLNCDSVVKLRADKVSSESTAARILELVETASERKARSENFITMFARFYTPIVVALALLLFLIPSIITGQWSVWGYRALSFLVVSCPCALVISVPMSFFAGIGCASKNGILVKGGNYLEALSKANTFVFDKTGTMTEGIFEVLRIEPEAQREEILSLAAIAEQGSTHPIARSILTAYGKTPQDGYELKELSGCGMVATCRNESIAVGNRWLMAQEGIEIPSIEEGATVVYVAKNGKYLGKILIGDRLKADTPIALAELKRQGYKTVMLTGDRQSAAAVVAQEAGVSEYRAELLPKDKVEAVEQMLADGDRVVFVGDGINDAPVLTRADVGIAMGGMGSDAAIEAADIVIMQDRLTELPLAKRIATRTIRIVKQNIIFALLVKVIVLVLSALGITNMWVAIFADVGVAVLAILNAMRAMKTPKPKKVLADAVRT